MQIHGNSRLGGRVWKGGELVGGRRSWRSTLHCSVAPSAVWSIARNQ
jgi:hypothetical protein